MIVERMTVLNIDAVKSTIRAAFARGDEDRFQGTKWYTLEGQFICSTTISYTVFDLILPDRTIVVVEVWG